MISTMQKKELKCTWKNIHQTYRNMDPNYAIDILKKMINKL